MVNESARRANVALRDDELERIAHELGREPSVTELHAFDAQWSEHCSYKSSRHHLKTLPVTGPDVVLGPAEDSGILHLGEHNGERYGIVIAHESHNHPSQVVPFEGAATGIGGIVRDVLCMGAEVIAVADPLRFGKVEDPQSHARYVARSAVDGIGAYGNAIGVPNLAGDVYFDERFDDNCLVNVVAMGIVKESEIVHSYAPEGAGGWDVVLVGKATDPSGFGGASFSSLTLDAQDEEANKGAVQVPDPFLKNVLMRATYRVFARLRELNITAGFKDLGAGGIMGCSAEIASSGGYGVDINLDEVNVAVEGMPPEVIAVGETQERLIWVVPPQFTPELLAIYNDEYTLGSIAFNARAGIVGRITAEKKYVLRHRGQVVMDVDIDFLTGSIKDELPFDSPASHDEPDDLLVYPEISVDEAVDLFPRILAHPNVCSRQPLFRRYDSVVRGCSVIPRGDYGAGMLAPVPGSPLGVALAVSGNPFYGRLDPRRAAELAVVNATLAVAATGARPVGLTDCLNFGNPRKRAQYSQLVNAIEGLGRAARELGLAYVSGNVSLYNESKNGAAIPASAIVACVGSIENVGGTVTPGLKAAGSALYAIGPASGALGGTVYADLLGIEDDNLPRVDYERLRAGLALLRRAVGRGIVRSCAAIADGGTLVAIAKQAFEAHRAGRGLGVELEEDIAWFDETPRFVVEVDDEEAFLALEGAGDVKRLGWVSATAHFAIEDDVLHVADLYDAWVKPLEEIYP